MGPPSPSTAVKAQCTPAETSQLPSLFLVPFFFLYTHILLPFFNNRNSPIGCVSFLCFFFFFLCIEMEEENEKKKKHTHTHTYTHLPFGFPLVR
ncbi:hypothetical protein BDF14DRAFT_1474157 [Spinellus fusiger]|nr:hypothetical protein BDF14DRAFT_1474157 [Spinellus fusiger]